MACPARLPLVLGRAGDPVSLLCFVIIYCQLQVTENPDSTSSNSKECILSPKEKPWDRVVLGWFTQQRSISIRQPGPFTCLFCLFCWPQELPSSPQRYRRAKGLTASCLPTWTSKGRLKEPLPQIKNGSILTLNHSLTQGLVGPLGFALCQGSSRHQEWCSLNTPGLCPSGRGGGQGAGWQQCLLRSTSLELSEARPERSRAVFLKVVLGSAESAAPGNLLGQFSGPTQGLLNQKL